MEKIDRLGWAAGMHVVAYGVRIGVRANDEKVLARIPDLLPPGWKPAASPVVDCLYSLVVGGAPSGPNIRRYNLLYAGAARLARTMELDEMFDALEFDLHLHVAATARQRLFVHAGVVGWRGRAIVIPGRSFSGKSTLVAALVRAGAAYYSDEYAVLDSRGRAHPFPRPLSLRPEPGKAARRYPVEVLGGAAGVKPLPVGVIVITRYRPGGRWRPRSLSPGQAALALLSNTVSARRHPELALTRLSRAMTGARALKGSRGEAEEMVDAILSKVDD